MAQTKIRYEQLSGVPSLGEVLTRTNTDVYTPSADYHPATKKYVDDNAGIVDGEVINGVANFIRTTVPTQRNDTSALQDNDRWYDSSTGRQWFRKGIYWISERIETDRNITTNGTRGRNCFQGSAATSIYIHSAEIVFDLLSPFMDANNYYSLRAYFVGIGTGNYGAAIFLNLNLFTSIGGAPHNASSIPINIAFTPGGQRGTSIIADVVGTPGTLSTSISFTYSLIYA